MHILLLRHYPLSEGPSMRAFADQIAAGLRSRGHTVQEFTAPVHFARLARRRPVLAKWLGYLDQFLLFPPLLLWRARSSSRTLSVFADQALGPWIPLLSHRPHVVHVHDLLALEAALGRQQFHHLGWSGTLYQLWIRRGFRRARCFLSVSQATRNALEMQLKRRPLLSDVLHNPLHSRFRPLPAAEAAAVVAQTLPTLGSQPFLFHIGRNWYKNRFGVLAIWEQLQSLNIPVHLVLVGAVDAEMHGWMQCHPVLLSQLHILDQASDDLIVALYNCASSFVFPSHAEGFGWPILEAMACGCPVVTTGEAPMSEVGGDAVTYIPPYPVQPAAQADWSSIAALRVRDVLQRTPAEQDKVRQQGYIQAHSFHSNRWLDQLEAFYSMALSLQQTR